MTDRKEQTRLPRREFLRTAGFVGAAAAGVAATGLAATESQAAKPGGAKSAGYRETEHVKKYYELAR